jgi:shikimate kinase
LVKDHGVTLWLDAPFELVRDRVAPQTHRPLARDPEKFAALFEARLPVYARADYRVSIEDDDERAAVSAILRLEIFD